MVTCVSDAVPLAPLTASDKSIHNAVPTVAVTTAEQVNGVLFAAAAPNVVMAPPLAVPVDAAPFVGAVPVPVII